MSVACERSRAALSARDIARFDCELAMNSFQPLANVLSRQPTRVSPFELNLVVVPTTQRLQ